MRRRDIFMLIGGGLVAWPLAARAQQGAVPVIGFLGTATSTGFGQFVTAFVKQLNELGWVEGRNVAIEIRWAEGRNDRYAEIAAEFVRLKAAVIVTSGAAIEAVKRTTSTIPIVFAVARDPVGSGFVASLSRPGGNITGLSNQASDLGAKRLDVLRKVIPSLRRLAVMANVGYSNTAVETNDVQAEARALGLEVSTLAISRAEDIAPAIERIKGHADALYVVIDPLMTTNAVRINTLALSAHVATLHSAKNMIEGGGLMSYGPNVVDLFRRSAEMVDKILRGANPGDIPVEQPTTFELVVNLTTAKALGLTIPSSVLSLADELVE
jgi:putative ABC transport system substrate-binding protein